MANDMAPLPSDRPLWERLDREPSRAFQAFVLYRTLPARSRSIDAVARQLADGQHKGNGRAAGYLNRYCRDWRWPERARAWDDERDRQAREGELQEIRDAHRRHVVIARAGLSKVTSRLATLDPARLTETDALRWAERLVAMERELLRDPLVPDVGRPQDLGLGHGGTPGTTLPYGREPPTAEFVADVMRLLDQHGALDEEPPHDSPAEDAGPTPRNRSRS